MGEFRKAFVYSSWGYALVTSAIEQVTGKPFSSCVEEFIFKPLGMTRSTSNLPDVDNIVFKHWVGTDGVAHEFPWSTSRGWSDETGFGGAVAGRSSTRELLIMYQSLLHAFNHQTKNDANSTPGSPFKYARRILSPHIGVGKASNEKQSYCLGVYRTELPGVISGLSFNSLLLQKQMTQNFGENLAGRVVYHQLATFTGYTGAIMLEPQSQTAVFVLANSLPLFDITDVLVQLLLGTVLGETSPPDYIGLAKSVRNANLVIYDLYAKGLNMKKTDRPRSFPLKAYEGDYWNKSRIVCYSVFALGVDQLKATVKGSILTEYLLKSWGGDMFCFPPHREWEASSSMWPFTSLKSRIFLFNCDKDDVLSFTWHHDMTPGSQPETFTKDGHDHSVKL